MLTVSLEHDRPKLALDFQLPRGQVSAIVGPSGSGKTSVLRAVAGLLSTR
ncbi:MAG: ATP-binding cassette domain-containing protein, partial [Acidiferrobacteraceae bacterium]|nr:ATP-binding cassette domain-containing protein [Acidiferrobacteraceae bacterium]